MTNPLVSSLVLAVFVFALPRVSAAQAAAAPAADRFSEATVADLSAQARVRDWDLASNSSNAGEIYAQLVKAGGKPVCQDKKILVDSDYKTVQDCQVTARVSPLTVITNYFVAFPTTVVVDVEGETACQSKWYVVALGRSRQKAERWVYCQVKGVARP